MRLLGIAVSKVLYSAVYEDAVCKKQRVSSREVRANGGKWLPLRGLPDVVACEETM